MLYTELRLYYGGSLCATMMQQGSPDPSLAVVIHCCEELCEAGQSLTLPQVCMC